METPPNESFWRKCTTCKKPIGFQQKYWVCSVSTCNRQRTGLVFCSVSCFDAHVPVMNHRDAGAFEKKAPTLAEWKREQEAVATPKSKPATAAPASQPQAAAAPSASQTQASREQEILVVVSKVKDYIRKKSGMNTSDAVMERLTTWVTRWCDESIRMATQHDRKTVLDRDIR